MGDVFQMLPGLCEVQAQPPADGADAPAAVRGGMGQRIRLQREVQPQGQKDDRVLEPTSVLLRERRGDRGTGHGQRGAQLTTCRYVLYLNPGSPGKNRLCL